MTAAVLTPSRRVRDFARHRLISSGAGRGVLLRRYFVVIALIVLPLVPVTGGSAASGSVAVCSFAASIVLPWLYWLLRCRACISVACIAAWGSSALLLLAGQLVLGYSSSLRSGAWAFSIGLIAFTGLAASYRRYLRAQFGWASLGPTDRSGVLLASGITAMATWTWAPQSSPASVRAAAALVGLGVVFAATLNAVGGARYAASRLHVYVAELDQHFPARVARALHRVLDPFLVAYSSASASVLVGGTLVAYLLSLPSLNLPKSAEDAVFFLGCAAIVTTPVLVQRRTATPELAGPEQA